MKRLKLIILILTSTIALWSCTPQRKFAKLIQKHPKVLEQLNINTASVNDTLAVIIDSTQSKIKLERKDNSDNLNKYTAIQDSLINVLIDKEQESDRDSTIILSLRNNLRNNFKTYTRTIEIYRDSCYSDTVNISIVIDSTLHQIQYKQYICFYSGEIVKQPPDTIYNIAYTKEITNVEIVKPTSIKDKLLLIVLCLLFIPVIFILVKILRNG